MDFLPIRRGYPLQIETLPKPSESPPFGRFVRLVASNQGFEVLCEKTAHGGALPCREHFRLAHEIRVDLEGDICLHGDSLGKETRATQIYVL
jgi:hypothetical protein